jgi:prephenate dehydrogenase
VECTAIFGVGLIGGSFALALRKAGFLGRIIGVSSPETIRRALELGVIDEGANPREAARRAQLIFLSQPIERIIETIPALAGDIGADTFVTDAGSTKARIMTAAECLPAGMFVGGHPMAGKEARGVDSADPDLFVGRPWALTARDSADLERAGCREFRTWLEKIGAVVVALDAETHDRMVALTSHLAQALSTALAATLGETFQHAAPPLYGPGLLDMTRLALSPWEIWSDIFSSNRRNLAAALDECLTTLQRMRDALHEPGERDIRLMFQRGSDFATALRKSQETSSQ